MRRFVLYFALVLSVLALAATTVLAASPQFKHGGDPVFTDNGKTLSVTASLTGLGNGDLNVVLSYNGTTVGNTCTSPGGNDAPGQNPATPASASFPFTVTPDKNGNLTFTRTTTAPTITAAQAGCPNKNWTASYTDVIFYSASVHITQASTGFDVTCTAIIPAGGTTDGGRYASTCTYV